MILARGENLLHARQRIRDRDSTLFPAYQALLRSADSALSLAPLSVTQKRMVPPSGDKHDYMSLAPYWWPDSSKPGGVPYIRRDGLMNPESRLDHDGVRLQTMIDAVERLALAHFFTGDARYSEHAGRLLRTWFVDPTTRMNPHLRFAQAIPGVTEGRGIGIIDTRHLPQLVDALRLLDDAPEWPDRDRDAVIAWTRAYLDWLLTSSHGREEGREPNNHGTWYDAQIVALALFVGDTALARHAVVDDTRARIDAQIARDGRQPHELSRTRPVHYSAFNLDALTALAEMARHVRVELWRSAGTGGGSLRSALYYVARFVARTAEPPLDVVPVSPDVFALPFARARAELGDPLFDRALAMLPDEYGTTHRARLLYPGLGLPPPRTAFDTLTTRALHFAAAQLRHSASTLDPRAGYPRVTRPDGLWAQQPANQWTSGFFAGALWCMYQATRDAGWRALAERWTAGLEGVSTITTTHDLGFMLFDSFGHGYLLTEIPHYKAAVLRGSRSLATRYDERVSAIKSWDTEFVQDRRQAWRFPVIVDNLMNLEMLFWAARNGDNSEWARIAERHALTSARAHVRPDGSTAHVALFNPTTGALERTVTWQGFSDSSAWARGQAWALNGFAMAYRFTRHATLLEAAQRTADFFIAHLPEDVVPYWDFRHPDIPNVERDASAAAIAASGLFDLARHVDAASAARYRHAAKRILTSLAEDFLAAGTPSASILLHSVGQRPQNVEVDVGLIYADYYFVEALLRARGLFLE